MAKDAGTVDAVDGDTTDVALDVGSEAASKTTTDTCVLYRCPQQAPASVDESQGGSPANVAFGWRRWPETVTEENLNDVWVTREGMVCIAGEHGTTLFFDGKRWSTGTAPTRATFNAVACLDGQNVWAGTAEAELFRFYQGHWSRQADLPTGTDPGAIHNIAMVSTKEAYLVHGIGAVLRFDGVTWSKLRNAWRFGESFALWSPGPERLWLANGGGLSTWNGKTFVENFHTSGQAYTSLHGSGPDDVWVVSRRTPSNRARSAHFDGKSWTFDYLPADISGVWSRHAREAWAVGDMTIRYWNGTTWQAQTTTSKGRLRAIAGTPDGRSWAVGDKGEIWFREPGDDERCTAQNCVFASGPVGGAQKNGCDGQQPLQGEPRSLCQPCGARWICAERDRVICSGASVNACGGCRPMYQAIGNPFPESPGASCGSGHIYICSDENYLSCTQNTKANICGGTNKLEHVVGTPCGDTADCRFACRGGTTVCICDARDAG